MIKIAMTGDDHLGVPKRSEEARRIFYWMIEDWRARGVHLICIGGDVVDGPMTERQRAELIEAVEAAATVAPVFLISGNHEIELSLRNALGGRERGRSGLIGREGVHPIIVEDGAGVHVIQTTAGPVACAGVSYPIKARLLAAVGRPVSIEESEQIAGQALQDVFRGLGVKVRELDLPSVGLFHGTIRGSKISADQPDRPLGLDVALADLTLMSCDFYCTPHVHLAQEWEYPSGVWTATPSSPFYCDYGEAKQEKGYILVQIDTDIVHVEPGDWAQWYRIPTPAVPMLLEEGAWVELPDLTWGLNTDGPSEEDIKGSDVRFRIRFPSDQRKAALSWADVHAKQLKELGAVNVTIDPIVIPTTKSRIPELATTVRLEDKIRLYWKAIGFEPSPEREKALMEMLHELQDDPKAQEFGMATGRTAPTLRKARLAGFMKFRDEISLNLDEIAGPLTAIVAPNETGKSLLVQLIGPGALYGETPNRGSLDELSIATDSFVNVEFDMAGARYDLTQVANGKSRTGHVSLLKNGQPELSKAGRKEYKDWRVKNLLPTSMYDALICQSGTEKFIDMADGPRVELLLRVLGLEVYEILAEMARKRANAVAEELAGVRQRIDEIGEVSLLALGVVVETETRELDGGKEEAVAARTVLEGAQSRAKAIETQRTEYAALVARQKELEEKERTLASLISELKTRLEVQQELMDEKDVIDKAVLELEMLTNEIASKQQSKQALEMEHLAGQGVLNQLRDKERVIRSRIEEKDNDGQALLDRLTATNVALETAQATLEDAEAIRAAVNETATHTAAWNEKRDAIAVQRTREAVLAGVLTEVRARFNGNAQRAAELVRKKTALAEIVATRDSVQVAVERVAELERDIATADSEYTRWLREAQHLQETLTSSKDARIGGLRKAHLEIMGGHLDPPSRSRKAVNKDDDLEAEAESTPPALITANHETIACEAALREFRAELKERQSTAGSLAVVLAAEKSLAEVTADLKTADTLHKSLMEESNGILAQQVDVERQRERNECDLRWLQEQIDGYVPLVERAAGLATIVIQIRALTEQQTQLEADAGVVGTSLQTLREEHAACTREDADKTEAVLAVINQITAAAQVLKTLDGQTVSLKLLAAKAPLLAEARVRIDGIEAQLGDVTDQHEIVYADKGDLNDKLSEMTEPTLVDLKPYEEAVDLARATVIQQTTKLALAEKALTDAQAKEQRRQELSSQIRGLEETGSNWTLLGLHLGKDHLQREEVACAGPQLTEITNDLLRTAGDTRHTVSIETEKLHSNKKQMIPTLDINVFDSEEQVTKESRRLSDAGKILVGEPFRFALVVMGCQRAGIKSLTVFTDEATGVMDSINAPRYIGMLRRFAEILDARVIFISQQPAIQDLADSRIFIDNGQITVG